MFQPTDVGHHESELTQDNEVAVNRRAAAHGPDTASLVTLANIGLVGVPLAYATSKSTLITLVAAALALLALIAYLRVGRNR